MLWYEIPFLPLYILSQICTLCKRFWKIFSIFYLLRKLTNAEGGIVCTFHKSFAQIFAQKTHAALDNRVLLLYNDYTGDLFGQIP